MTQRKPKPLSDSKLAKVKKALGPDTVQEMDKMIGGELDKQIVTSVKSIEQAKEEMEENPKYVEASGIVSDFKGGFNGVKKRQQAKIAYARHLLAEKGLE